MTFLARKLFNHRGHRGHRGKPRELGFNNTKKKTRPANERE